MSNYRAIIIETNEAGEEIARHEHTSFLFSGLNHETGMVTEAMTGLDNIQIAALITNLIKTAREENTRLHKGKIEGEIKDVLKALAKAFEAEEKEKKDE